MDDGVGHRAATGLIFWLEFFDEGCPFPKLYSVTINKLFGSVSCRRLVRHFKVNARLCPSSPIRYARYPRMTDSKLTFVP